MAEQGKALAAPPSAHSVDNPNPNPPLLLRAAVRLTRAAARLTDAAIMMDQALADIRAAQQHVAPGMLWDHNCLRAAVVVRVLDARVSTERLFTLAKEAERLAAPRTPEPGAAAHAEGAP